MILDSLMIITWIHYFTRVSKMVLVYLFLCIYYLKFYKEISHINYLTEIQFVTEKVGCFILLSVFRM